MRKAPCRCLAKFCAKLLKPISRNHCPTRHTRPTRPTLLSAKREAHFPYAASTIGSPAVATAVVCFVFVLLMFCFLSVGLIGNGVCGCTVLLVLQCRVGRCSVRGQYRPNCAPNTESAVGSHVRPSRQSRDCLRGRPFRAPALSVMVRSALGPVLPTVARARWRLIVASPLCQ